MSNFDTLLTDIKGCTLCRAHLPEGPQPVFQAHPAARILIAGQAPGIAAHRSGIPFNDPSGDRLRAWLGIDRATFYNASMCALVPMGFCYPGRGKGGDLPPRKECAPKWRTTLLGQLNRVELIVCVGRYAIDWHLTPQRTDSLSDIVANWRTYWPDQLPLPHPSPRNTRWLNQRPWVEAEIIPLLQARVHALLA